MNRLLVPSLCLLLLFAACTKDKGNYSYQEINRITIEGVNNFYVVNYGERITIKPKLSFTDGGKEDTAIYSFQWIQNRLFGYTGNGKVLTTSRDLDTIYKTGFGNYEMIYRVTDKRTGVFTDAIFSLTIGAASYEGWMALCDTEDGAGRLDMVSRRGPTEVVYKNVLDSVRSAFKITSKPTFIGVANTLILPSNGSMCSFIGTADVATTLGRDTLNYLPTYNITTQIAGTIKPANYSDARIYLRTYAGVLYADSKLFRVDISSFSTAVNKQDAATTYFKPSPYVALGTSSSIVFNEDSKTFLRLAASGTACISLPKGQLFDYTLPDSLQLMWMDYTPYNGGEIFALSKSKITNKVYLGRFIEAGTRQNYYDAVNAEGIANAENFCVSPDYGYLFYNIGSKVYEYDFSLKRAILMKDYGSKKISLMKFHRFVSTSSAYLEAPYYIEHSKKLIVCTYDAGNAASSGNLDLYTVPAINGAIRSFKSFAGGLGKIVSLTYRER